MNSKWLKTVGVTVLTGALLFTGCGINKSASLVTVDGKEAISLGYGYFAARYTQSMYDQYLLASYGEQMWSQETTDSDGKATTMEDQVKSELLNTMEETYLLRAHADEYGVKVSDDEKKTVAKAAKKFMKDNDEKTLKEMGATQDIVEEYLTNQLYDKKVTEAVKAKTKVDVSDEDAATNTFSFVEFSTAATTDTTTGQKVELTDDEKAALKEQAEAVAAADDMEAEAEKQGTSVHSSSFDNNDNPLDASIMEVLRGMSEGQVSDVMEVDGDGYYVVRLDKINDKEATDKNRESLEEEQRTTYFNEIIKGWKSDVKIKVDKKAWKKVKFDTLFKAAATENAK